MATLKEHIYTVANMRKGWLRSDDDSVSDRQYAFIINYYRAFLIEQEVNKKRILSGDLIQNLGKVRLIETDKNGCSTTGNCILRIQNPLPSAVDSNGNNLITYVGAVNGNVSYQRITANSSPWTKYSKFTGLDPKWYQVGSYIYIDNPPSNVLKYINIKGIFEDPIAANLYKTCDEEGNEQDCYEPYDFEYPMPVAWINTIIKLMQDSELRFGQLIPQDKTNDTNDN